jgi:hypothetical protein
MKEHTNATNLMGADGALFSWLRGDARIKPGFDPTLGQNMADFTFPSYRQPQAPPPYDYLGLVVRQGQPAPGGFNFDPARRGGQ